MVFNQNLIDNVAALSSSINSHQERDEILRHFGTESTLWIETGFVGEAFTSVESDITIKGNSYDWVKAVKHCANLVIKDWQLEKPTHNYRLFAHQSISKFIWE